MAFARISKTDLAKQLEKISNQQGRELDPHYFLAFTFDFFEDPGPQATL